MQTPSHLAGFKQLPSATSNDAIIYVASTASTACCHEMPGAGWLLADIVYGAPTYQHLFDSKVATAVGWRKIQALARVGVFFHAQPWFLFDVSLPTTIQCTLVCTALPHLLWK
jgi:hypothetical protein